MAAMVARPFFLGALMGLTLLTAATLPAAEALARAQISSARLGTHPDNVTRVVMDVSENLTFSTAVQATPDRVVINAGDLDWNDETAARRAFGLVRGLRYDQGRILIDLKEPALVKSSFMIPPRDGQGWRLVVDVQKTSRAAFLSAAAPVPPPTRAAAAPQAPATAPAESAAPRAIVVYSPAAAAPAAPATTPAAPIVSAPPPPPPIIAVSAPSLEKPTPAPSEPAPQRPRTTASGTPMLSAPVPPPLARPVIEASAPATTPTVTPVATPEPEPEQAALPARAPAQAAPQPRSPRNEGKAVIVLDPGHGGVDPGALGVSGIYEKHITLAMARELKTQLERSGRYKVHLTRDRDIFIRLRERVAIARQYGADLFISLHADSVNNPQLAGLSVYTLSQTASDSEAQSLADKENKADLLAGIDLSHESADVANILIDLAQRETMNRSAGFAGGVVDELGRDTTLLGNTHRFAGFAVLKAPDVPSILVELGYLSNPDEERKLRQPDYRAKLAKGIARAVDRHFLEGQKARRP